MNRTSYNDPLETFLFGHVPLSTVPNRTHFRDKGGKIHHSAVGVCGTTTSRRGEFTYTAVDGRLPVVTLVARHERETLHSTKSRDAEVVPEETVND